MSGKSSFRVFDESTIRDLATDRLALDAAEEAFRALGSGVVTVPPTLSWEFPRVRGQVNVKGAHFHGSRVFTFKVGTSFFGNVEFGIPLGSGLVIIFDAATGFPRGILADNGYLTELRAAASGALAARHLTHDRPLKVAVLGTGVQAHLQTRLLKSVRPIESLSLWSRYGRAATRLQKTLADDLELESKMIYSVEEAVADADLVITTSASGKPVLESAWLRPSATVIAIGSETPGKNDLDPEVLSTADKLVTDLTEQCLRWGELRHAVESGLVPSGGVHAELGEIVTGEAEGREHDERIVCDLTGVAALDAVLAERVYMELTGEDPSLGAVLVEKPDRQPRQRKEAVEPVEPEPPSALVDSVEPEPIAVEEPEAELRFD